MEKLCCICVKIVKVLIMVRKKIILFNVSQQILIMIPVIKDAETIINVMIGVFVKDIVRMVALVINFVMIKDNALLTHVKIRVTSALKIKFVMKIYVMINVVVKILPILNIAINVLIFILITPKHIVVLLEYVKIIKERILLPGRKRKQIF